MSNDTPKGNDMLYHPLVSGDEKNGYNNNSTPTPQDSENTNNINESCQKNIQYDSYGKSSNTPNKENYDYNDGSDTIKLTSDSPQERPPQFLKITFISAYILIPVVLIDILFIILSKVKFDFYDSLNLADDIIISFFLIIFFLYVLFKKVFAKYCFFFLLLMDIF